MLKNISNENSDVLIKDDLSGFKYVKSTYL